jgi:hypothetical protein
VGVAEAEVNGIGWRGFVRKEGIIKSADDRPSLGDLRACLLSSVDFAEDFARNRPEYTDAVTRFTQEVLRIKRELMTAFQDDLHLAPLHDIVNGLTGARGMASIMAERHPEKSGPLTRFVEGLEHAQEEFIRKVKPEVYRQT